ncbi:MAG TPA: DUF6788 family protein [Candidatus Scalindua sp.]|jgi:hypothetical protein|nr:DUF6788 family protein [Candidatus Scalindua sp.]|tara:strand:+ start:1611 stop:1931 length:321 start_codon:yes stop_codon:yes gene_type:complete
MDQKRLKKIEKRIEKIKAELSQIGEMRPGSLNPRYNKDYEKTNGPYYQLSYTHEMKSRTKYIRPESVNEIREQIKTYKRFKELTTEWVNLGIEHSTLSLKLKKEKK